MMQCVLVYGDEHVHGDVQYTANTSPIHSYIQNHYYYRSCSQLPLKHLTKFTVL